MNLAEMSLVELGFLLLCEDCQFDRNQIKFELARRQRMLDAADKMRLSLSSYVEGVPQEDAANYSFYRDRLRAGYEALNAYAAAKETP